MVGELKANRGILAFEVFLESEFNTASLQTLIWSRNLFDAGTRQPRFYRRATRNVSQQLPSLGWDSGSTIQYPEHLDLSEKLHSGETLDIVLRPGETQYVIVLVANKRSMPNAKAVIIGMFCEFGVCFLSLTGAYRSNQADSTGVDLQAVRNLKTLRCKELGRSF